MDNEIFDIKTWGQTINNISHESRFNKWFNALSGFVVDDHSFSKDQVNVKFSNGFRISKLPSTVKVDPTNTHFVGKDGAGSLFTCLLSKWDDDEMDDEDLGAKYLGTSLVFFPCYEQEATKQGRKTIYKNKLLPSGIILALGMGSGGPGPDERLVSNPGHIRRFEGFLNSIKDNIVESETIIWFRDEPIIRKSVPDIFQKKTKAIFGEANPHALGLRNDSGGGYGQYIYAIASLKFDNDGNLSTNQKTIFEGFSNFYFRERGWKKEEPTDLAISWYQSLFGKVDKDVITDKLGRNKYLILAGPPGIKKTDLLNQMKENYYNNYLIRQFHPNTTYQNFVGGIQPALKGSVGFEFYKGPLIEAIERASKLKQGENFLLIIDEINRADLSSVLGEAVNLFEPTKKYSVLIPNYTNEKGEALELTMPDNLHVLCAMNTADRNISSIDVAIRRRFAFLNIWPEEPIGPISCEYGRGCFNSIKNLFFEYGNKNDLNLMPGGYYFIGKNEQEVKDVLKDRLLPLLEDYLQENRISKILLTEIDLYIKRLKQNL
jgi:5-methylcytosine-specific restriction protein B